MSSCLLLVVALFTGSSLFVPLVQSETASTTDYRSLDQGDLKKLVETVRGNDNRLFRWDAAPETALQQRSGGCSDLHSALHLLTVDDPTKQAKASLACEYATFCITDNPTHRAYLKDHPGIHKAIVDLVKDKETSVMASHLIYIASFADAVNHQGFIAAGAVPALAEIVKDEDGSTPAQVMWAAAALQNLAASYCDTKGDGRCYWDWKEDDLSINHVVLTDESLPVLSSGEKAREQMMEDTALVEMLVDWTCDGPVEGEMTITNPYPGENAEIGTHDKVPTIVPWAAAGALKNLALLPAAKPLIDGPALECLCRMSLSEDWLEAAKAEDAIYFLRRGDPCWFEDGNEATAHSELCVDHDFLDNNGVTCSDYGELEASACEVPGRDGTTLPKDACCACGGGDREEEHEEL